MRCPKCKNLMVSERFADYAQSGDITFWGWRCLSCGLILDRTILAHKSRSKGPKGGRDARHFVGVK